jgi:O-antigen biosynthesis protein
VSKQSIKNLIKSWTKYDPKIMGVLQDKCSRETKVGRIANLAIRLLFALLIPLKKMRHVFQRLVGAKVPAMPLLPLDDSLRSEGLIPCSLPRVLIIAELSIPQCTRYRVMQKKKALEGLGYEVLIESFTNYKKCLGSLPLCSAVIFYRTPHWSEVETLINECRRQSIVTIYDIDDLVFDLDEYSRHPVLNSLSPQERDSLLRGAKAYQQCLAATDHAIASTDVLAQFMRKYCRGKVFVLDNALDDVSLAAAKLAEDQSPRTNSEKVVIGYGSGTKSHDHDFAIVSPALSALMRSDTRVHLVIHGYLNLGKDFKGLESRIQRVPFLEAKEYLVAVSQFDINLAPLAANVFNDAKSNIKFLEASAVGVPSIVSSAESFLTIAKHQETALVASSQQEWIDALNSLVGSEKLRRELGLRASQAVQDQYSPERTREKLKEILAELGVGKAATKIEQKKRILLVNCLFAPTSFGGATLVVEQLAKELGANAEVGVFTLNQFEQIDDYGVVRYDAFRAQVFSVRFPIEKYDSTNWQDPKMEKIFEDVLEAFRPDTVHFHAVQGIGGGVVNAAKKSGSQVILTLHDAWWLCERQFMLTPRGTWCGQRSIDIRTCLDTCSLNSASAYKRYFYLRSAANMADVILAPSKWHADLMSASLGRPVLINKNGTVKPKTLMQQHSARPLTFAFIGGGESIHKGYGVVKKIFESLTRSDYRLVLVDLHKKLGLSKIKAKDWKILGELKIAAPFTHENIDEFFADIDVLLCPTLVPESFGMAAREATVRGIWVIAMDAGGLAEDLTEGKTGVVTPMGDVEAFTKAVHQAFDLKRPLSVAATASNIRSFSEQAAELVGTFYN